jgi:transcription elongation factor Elf1
MTNEHNPKTDREQKVFKDEYDQTVECPWCKSTDTQVASPFGGTVSEILFKCNGCKQTFGWMKWQHKMPE